MLYQPPLHLHVASVVGSRNQESSRLASAFSAWFSGDERTHSIPEANLPVYHWEGTPSEPPRDVPWGDASRSALLMIVDDEMVASPSWRAWAVRQAQSRRQGDLLLVCALTPNFPNIGPPYAALHAVRCFAIPERERVSEAILIGTHAITKWAASPLGEPPGTVRLFISHAKAEHRGVSGRTLALALKSFVESRPAGVVFFDEVDIIAGDEFATTLETQLTNATVIVLLTDKFSTRYWCGWEVVTAKQKGCPVLAVDSLHEGEPVSLGLLGKVPMVRWSAATDAERSSVDMHRSIISAALLETLRHSHESERTERVRQLAYSGEPSVVSTGFAPELSTLPADDCATLVHPDPPVPVYELEVIHRQRPRVKLRSATQALAEFTGPIGAALRGMRVALSISNAPDQRANGITAGFGDRLWLSLNLHLLHAGAHVAYGGDLRTGGFTARLYDLARSAVASGRGLQAESIHWYLAWPTAVAMDVADLAAIPRAFAIHELAAPVAYKSSAAPPSPPRDLTSEQQVAWAVSLSEMRVRMGRESHARILVGGQTRGVSPWPGLLEEFETSVGKPQFLVGALGGMTSVLVRALRGDSPVELTDAYQDEGRGRAAMRSHYAQVAGREGNSSTRPLRERVAALNRLGTDGLQNGLNSAENSRLFVSRDITEIVSLVLKGLKAVHGGRV